MYSTYILQDLYYIYYKTYTMKLMLHIYYDVHVYDKTNIYTFRHTVHYIYYKTYTMRLILYILSHKVRISASQIANCEAIFKIAKICEAIFLRIAKLIILRRKSLHYVVRRYATL